jgi:hypothetical protein
MALSQTALQGVLASSTELVFLECLKVEHSEINTLRLVNNTEDVVRGDGTYSRFAFSVRAETQMQGQPPQISIDADAVDQRIVLALRQLAGKRERAKITFDVVLADSPDTVEFGPVEFEFDSISGNSATQVSVKASFLKGALNDAFPAKQFAPSNASA